MAKRIRRLKDLEKIPSWSVVYYKESGVFSYQGDDIYLVGIVIPRNIPECFMFTMATDLKKAFSEAHGEMLSRVDEEQRREVKTDPRYLRPTVMGESYKEYLRDKSDCLPPRKTLLGITTSALPEDSRVVKIFAQELEKILKPRP